MAVLRKKLEISLSKRNIKIFIFLSNLWALLIFKKNLFIPKWLKPRRTGEFAYNRQQRQQQTTGIRIIMADEKAKFLLEIISKFLDKKSVLLIDDEDEIKSLMANYLTKSHIEEKRIVLASDGKEALAKIQNQEFGLIIVDVLMPRMNGLQLIKEIKLRAKYKDIPVLLISGTLEAENVKTAIALGINNILVKPFTYNIFIEKIGRALGI